MTRLFAWLRLGLASMAALALLYLVRPVPAAEMTLEELIEAVRENELLYANIDVTLRRKYNQDPAVAQRDAGVQTDQQGTSMKIITSSETLLRYVAQGELYRIEKTGHTHHVGEEAPETFVEIGAYDGTTSRGRMGRIGNVVAGRHVFGGPVLAHGLFTLMGGEYVPLSVKLGGEVALRAHPGARMSTRTTLTVEYKGTEEVSGLRCHVVWLVKRWREGEPHGGEPESHVAYWLAEERNLIPIRYESYPYYLSRTVPVTQGEVTDWLEVEPGIWFPKRVIITTLDQRSLYFRGARVHNWTCEWLTEAVSLQPEFDISFFRDVEFPEGTIVYEVKGNQITRGYQEGAPGAAAPQGGAESGEGPGVFAVAAIVIVAFLVGAGILWKRRRAVAGKQV